MCVSLYQLFASIRVKKIFVGSGFTWLSLWWFASNIWVLCSWIMSLNRDFWWTVWIGISMLYFILRIQEWKFMMVLCLFEILKRFAWAQLLYRFNGGSQQCCSSSVFYGRPGLLEYCMNLYVWGLLWLFSELLSGLGCCWTHPKS